MRIGPYETLSELGRGGMGVVYRARSPGGADVAVKVLLGAEDPEARAGFEREQRLLGSFGEPDGFVPLLDAGVHAGRPYLVMPLVPGGTLKARLERGPLSVEEATALGRELARALGRAHAQGVVHRDLKPANVLFSKEGRPLVADLGLAKHFRRDVPGGSQSDSVSAPGTIVGTPGYMAPEQLEDSKRVGPAADVFALGVLLFESLAKVRPFPGSGYLGFVDAIRKGPAPPLGKLRPDVPAWLEDVVARALERDPGARFPDARAVGQALAPRAGRTRAGRPWLAGAVGAGVLLVLGGAGLGRLLRGEPGGAAPPVVPAPAGTPGAGPRATPDPPPGPTPSPPGATKDRARSVELVKQARAKVKQQDLAGALADTTEAIRLDPDHALAWGVRAGVRSVSGDPKGAVADSSRAIELDPRNALWWADRAGEKVELGDADGAIADATRALELDPRSARAFRNRAMGRAGKGDLPGAIADLTTAIEIDPGRAQLWGNRGAAKLQNRDLPGAIADCTRAIDLDPSDAAPFLNRGCARQASGDLEGSLQDLDESIKLEPRRNPRAYYSRALAKAKLASPDWPGALEDVTKAIELDPSFAPNYRIRAMVRQEAGDVKGALEDYERFLVLDPRGSQAGEIRKKIADLRGSR